MKNSTNVLTILAVLGLIIACFGIDIGRHSVAIFGIGWLGIVGVLVLSKLKL